MLPSVRDARERGVLFGVGHGGGSFDDTVAEPALEQGFAPDFISSDIHVFSGNSPGRPCLPDVVSKLLGLGMSLDEEVAKASTAPGRAPSLGTLEVGGVAGIAVMGLVEGEVELVDAADDRRAGVAAARAPGRDPRGRALRPALRIPLLPRAERRSDP